MDTSVVNSQGFCTLCSLQLPSNKAKTVTQHLKTLQHKKNIKVIQQPSSSDSTNSSEETSSSQEADFFAPNEARMPKEIPVDYPFFSKRAVIHASVPDQPHNLFEVASRYCNPSTNLRLPNIDINNVRVVLPSWSKARKLLVALSEVSDLSQADLPELVESLGFEYKKSELQTQYNSWWVAFQIPDMQHPPWWVKRGKPVPTYDQLIASCGPTDIGIHIDTYGPNLKPVDTYLTILYGKKIVTLVPPGEASDKFYKEYEDSPYPSPTVDPDRYTRFIQQVKALGGFYFEFSAEDSEPMTVIFPKGWYHWVLNISDWSLLLSASQF